MPSADAARLAARVFAIPELLERILLNAHPEDVWFAQSVDRTFSTTIAASIKLQRHLCVKPLPFLDVPATAEYDDTVLADMRLNPFADEERWAEDKRVQIMHTLKVGEIGACSLAYQFLRDGPGIPFSFTLKTGNSKQAENMEMGVSDVYTKTYITQPPYPCEMFVVWTPEDVPSIVTQLGPRRANMELYQVYAYVTVQPATIHQWVSAMRSLAKWDPWCLEWELSGEMNYEIWALTMTRSKELYPKEVRDLFWKDPVYVLKAYPW